MSGPTLTLLSGVKGEYAGDAGLDGGVGVDSTAVTSSWDSALPQAVLPQAVMWLLSWLRGTKDPHF